jgi:hypothetical protein
VAIEAACAPAAAELRALCDAAGVTATTVPDALLQELARTSRVELSPLCAVFGGMVASEVLK